MNKINIVEVGPRDGLQNVKEFLSFDQKKNFIQCLMEKGFNDIEAGAFVRPDKVPSMADTDKIAQHFKKEHSKLWYLVPNLKGLQTALQNKVTQIVFFTASSNTFNTKNIGMTTGQSLDVIHECVEYLRDNNYHIINDWGQKPANERQIKLRLYISTVIACPYTGKMAPKHTLALLDELIPLGFAQVSLGDTIGMGVPKNWKELLGPIDKKLFQKNQVAMHCHDTYATALACIAYGLEHGVATFDSSIGGLGGCPFAPGATGNLATEDLVYFLEKEGLDCSIQLKNLLDVFDETKTGPLTNRSKVALALKTKQRV